MTSFFNIRTQRKQFSKRKTFLIAWEYQDEVELEQFTSSPYLTNIFTKIAHF